MRRPRDERTHILSTGPAHARARPWSRWNPITERDHGLRHRPTLHRPRRPVVRVGLPGRLHHRGSAGGSQALHRPGRRVSTAARARPACPNSAIFRADQLPSEWVDFAWIDAAWYRDPDAARAVVLRVRAGRLRPRSSGRLPPRRVRSVANQVAHGIDHIVHPTGCPTARRRRRPDPLTSGPVRLPFEGVVERCEPPRRSVLAPAQRR